MPKGGGLPVRTLRIFLGKRGIAAQDLLAKGKDVTSTPLGALGGTLYTKASASKPPSWASLFAGSVDVASLSLRTASAAALLVLPVEDRMFALTFGYGRCLLDLPAVEDSFGLRVTLNGVDDGNIRSIDRRTFDGITTHIREQASKEGSFGDFGLNVERDLLRAIVGSPKDSSHGLRLAGMDALSAACRVDLAGLPTLLARYLTLAADTSYRSRHPWIDNIAEVRDPTVVDRLNARLVEDLRVQNLHRKWMSVPDLMEWHDIGGFRYRESDKAELLHDIQLSSYLGQLKSPGSVSLEDLRRHRVRVISATTDQEIERWPVFKCIYAEVELDDASYLLSNGEWYKIDQDFARSIDKSVRAIPTTSTSLVAYQEDEDEAAYNKRLAESLGGCLMDQQNVSFGGGRSKIEFCDILTDTKQLIHVKRYSGSAVLSHLFAQGAVSAMAFVSDAEFRKKVNKKLCPGYKLSDPRTRPDAKQWEVAYVIASASSHELCLPFFSRVTLRNAARQLESLGFRVTLTKVGVEA